MSKEAMKLALEALEYIEHNYMSLPAPAEKAITALREALAEQPAQQEPVAYGMWDTMLCKGNRMMMVRLDKGQDGCTVPLYTTPQAHPAQRTWVGLTDEEILAANYPDGEENGPTISAPDFELDCFAKQVEAKLKEKNT